MKNTHEHHSSFSRKSKHINESERQQIERWLKQKMPVREIAALLDRHRSTIYREIKRGLVDHIKSDLSTEVIYQADHAQGQHNKNRGAGGPGMKLSTNSPLINEFRYQMEVRKLSPYAALKKIQKKQHVPFCQRSLYNYINLYNMPIDRSSLPMQGRRRRGHLSAANRLARNNVRGTSIERRPSEILSRSEVGHWEMDLVVGRVGSKKTLLVLTERKTRFEYIILLRDKSQKSVVSALNRLERKYGAKRFRETFLTITCDNGSEFLDYQSIEKSALNKGKRVKLYYAHPFSSFERGSNENANRFIRRILPKKTSFETLTQQDVDCIAEWMNRYPRQIFNGRSARQTARAEKLYCITLSA